jgi:exodeoxyribonuclease-5
MPESDRIRRQQIDVLNRGLDELSRSFYTVIDERAESEEAAGRRLRTLAAEAIGPHFKDHHADAIAMRTLDATAVLQLLAYHAEVFELDRPQVIRLIEARNILHHRLRNENTGREYAEDPTWGVGVVEEMRSVVARLGDLRAAGELDRFREFLIVPKPREIVGPKQPLKERARAGTRAREGRAIDSITLVDEQLQCISRVRAWWSDPASPRFISISGEAGSGKTTVLARLLTEMLEAGLSVSTIAIATPTTKAREVLRDKLPPRAGLRSRMTTLASLVWRFARPDHDGEDLVFSKLGEKQNDQVRNFEQAQLVFVDEASMVTRAEHEALTRRYRVVYFGDADQLPPVIEDGGVEDGPSDEPAGVLEQPDVRLHQVHRQADESPILQAAARVRTGQQLEFFEWTDNRVSILQETLGHLDPAAFEALLIEHDVVLAGRNITRLRLNSKIRALLGHESFPGDAEPKRGEILIATQNMRDVFDGRGINNGERLVVDEFLAEVSVRRDRPEVLDYRLFVHVETEPSRGGEIMVSSQYLRGDQIRGRQIVTRDVSGPRSGILRADWGYAITVHKAQGSEWPRVMVVDDLDLDDRVPRNRWNYVAYTRAIERLTVVKLAGESRLV